MFPFDIGYFEDFATTDNQLWGDLVYVDFENGITADDTLVHIEADPDFDASSTPTAYTFRGRYTQAEGGIDHREPLASAWGMRYHTDEGVADTDFVVWRDSTSGAANGNQGYPCGTGPGTGPDWKPLAETQVLCLDDQESAFEICGGVDDPACFPLETQKTRVGAGHLTLPFASGWCFVNLNIPGDAIDDDVDFPPEPPGDVAQSYVAAIRTGDLLGSAFSGGLGGLGGLAMASACQDVSSVIDSEGDIFLTASSPETCPAGRTPDGTGGSTPTSIARSCYHRRPGR